MSCALGFYRAGRLSSLALTPLSSSNHILCLFSQPSIGKTCRKLSKTTCDSMNVFDRKAKRLQKERASLLENYSIYDYLKEEVGWRVSDRLFDIKRTFHNALDLGCGRGYVGQHLLQETVGSLHQTDVTPKLLNQSLLSKEVPTTSIVVDEEYLPFRENTFDLVLSSLSLHWVNDLPGTFKQVNRVLVNDGCFIGCMFGGDTLHELRVSLYLAEMERRGGFSAHISPYTSAQDLGGLLHRAGFVMLTIDIDDIVINYPSMMELMFDLKGMGESNCAWSRCSMLPKETIVAASAIYQEKFGNRNTTDESGNSVGSSVPAMFQIIHFIAWKQDKSQLQAAKRGTGEVSMKNIGRLDSLTKQIEELKNSKNLDERMIKNIEELQKSADKIASNNSKNDDDDNVRKDT